MVLIFYVFWICVSQVQLRQQQATELLGKVDITIYARIIV